MADSLLKPFVIAVTFFAMISLVMYAAANLVYSNQLAQDIPTGVDVIAGIEYEPWYPAPKNMTGEPMYDEISDVIVDNDPASAIFYPDGEDESYKKAIKAYVIHNNTDILLGLNVPESLKKAAKLTDMVLFKQKTGAWFGAKYRYAAVPFEDILSEAVANDSSALEEVAITFMLGKANVTMFIQEHNNSQSFGYNVWVHDFYNMTIAFRFGDNIHHDSVWQLIGMMLTGRLPDVPEFVNWILLCVIWIPVAFVVVAFVTRLIPTIQGL